MSARNPLSADEQKSAFIGFAVLLVIAVIVMVLGYSYKAMLAHEEAEAWKQDQRIGSCESDRCQEEYQAAAAERRAQRDAQEAANPGSASSSCFTDWDEDGEPYRLCPDIDGGDVSEGYAQLQEEAEEPVWRK